GLGINVGTMGKDLTVGVTVHNFIENKWLLNLYGSWDYRFFGYQSWKHTGSVGIGFGKIKSLVNLKKPIYFNKEKKKYFKSLGIGSTLDIEQKFSKDAYIGGRYGDTLWGQLNRNMLGLSLGIDHTRIIGSGMYGKVHYSFLFGK
ncbi:hypothetical protein SAMN02745150_00821, partial [Brevinema andersonii]